MTNEMANEEAIAILEEESEFLYGEDKPHNRTAFDMAIKALSENKENWIPVTKRLPEDPYACLVTVWDANILTQEEFENVLPYPVGYDGETWNDGDGNICPFEVIAWKPFPTPYKAESGEV